MAFVNGETSKLGKMGIYFAFLVERYAQSRNCWSAQCGKIYPL